MGYMIGMPCLKLNNVGRKTGSCGSFSAVSAEALEERQGRDPDIDRERSSENIYTGFRTAAELQEYSRAHVAALSADLQAQGKRKIREDAVVMMVTIIKPPAAFMATLSAEDRVRFFADAKDKLADIVGEENIKSTVQHVDEQGDHLHVFWEPMTKDGRLCAKDVCNLKFFGRLNREMPAFLRSRGWDIEDCQAYDEAKEQLKSEQEKYQERRERGRSSTVYKAQAEAEKNNLMAEVDGLRNDLAALEGRIEATEASEREARAKTRQALETAYMAEIRANEAMREAQDAEQHLVELRGAIQTTEEYTFTADELQETLSDTENIIDDAQELVSCASRFERKKAAEIYDRLSKRVMGQLEKMKGIVARLLGFEKRTRMPKEKRRSPGLDARIRNAEAKVDRGGKRIDQDYSR